MLGLQAIPKTLYVFLGIILLFLVGFVMHLLTGNLIATFIVCGILYIAFVIMGYSYYDIDYGNKAKGSKFLFRGGIAVILMSLWPFYNLTYVAMNITAAILLLVAACSIYTGVIAIINRNRTDKRTMLFISWPAFGMIVAWGYTYFALLNQITIVQHVFDILFFIPPILLWIGAFRNNRQAL